MTTKMNPTITSNNRSTMIELAGHDHGHDHRNSELEDRRDHGHDHEHSGVADSQKKDCSCCSGDHGHKHAHPVGDKRKESNCCATEHGHDHAHSGKLPLHNEDDDCCGHDHGHDHGHSNEQEHDDCCGHDHGHDHGHTEDNCCGDDHNHDHHHSNDIETGINKSGKTAYSPLISEQVVQSRSCKACDPGSPIPHDIQMTRLRVANLCCAGEEKIIRATLANLTGVEHIAVNVIGRYVVVKHCSVECCAPTVKMVDMLNAKQLGVSIQEVGGSNTVEEESIDLIQLLHVTFVAILFVIGLVLHLAAGYEEASMWIYIISVIVGILPILYSSYVTVFLRHTIDIHVLLVIAVIGALAAAEYFDASLVVALFLFAEFVESVVMQQVRRAISSTSTATPSEAYLSDGRKVKVEDLKTGDIISVRAGEMILGDGLVVKGDGVVDESALTGESYPIQKKVGSEVFSGTVVQNGYIEIKLTSDFGQTTLNKLNQAVMDVQTEQGEYSKIVDQFSVYWTPGILITAFLLVILGGGATGDWYLFLYRGLVVLILACPCAIVIATPIPSVCAIVRASKHGVLIKGSSIVERLGTINNIALDKTGTLTKGFFRVADKLLFQSEEDGDSLDYNPLQLAAALEQKSTHPLANAIISDYCGCIAEMSEFELTMPSVKKVQVIEGIGLSGWVEVKEENQWKFVEIGNEKLFKVNGGKVDVSGEKLHQYNQFTAKYHGYVILCVVIDDELVMVLALADEVRNEAKQFIHTLQSSPLSIPVSMITGDHDTVARSVCNEVGIPSSECYSRLKPNDKLEWVKERQHHNSNGHVAVEGSHSFSWMTSFREFWGRLFSQSPAVLMVGDGINDATALTAASVGVAMGAGGSAMAVTSADVVLMSDNLMLLPAAIKLCRLARSTMIQGFVFAVAVKIVAIVLAILGLLEFWHAIVIDIGSLIIVVINGMRPWFSNYYNKKMIAEE
eukprot:gene8920-9657_t